MPEDYENIYSFKLDLGENWTKSDDFTPICVVDVNQITESSVEYEFVVEVLSYDDDGDFFYERKVTDRDSMEELIFILISEEEVTSKFLEALAFVKKEED